MKTFKMMAMAFMAVAMCANFASCSNEDTVLDEPKGEEYVTVKLGCGGEILDIKNSPLSRAEGESILDDNDLLLLTLHEMEKYEDSWGDVSYYEKSIYAYAVMSYPGESLELNLLKGREYRVQASVIVDGKDSYSVGCNSGEKVSYDMSSIDSYYLSEIHRVRDGQYGYDRFYGMVNNFTADEGVAVNVDLKRVAYGVEFKVNENELSDGESLMIKVARYSDSFYEYDGDYAVNLDSKDRSHYRVKTMNEINEAWSNAMQGNECTEVMHVTITWNKNVVNEETDEVTGTEEINMGTYEISFKRNAKTRITIKPQDLTAGGSVSFTVESWGEDVYFDIENGQVTQK